MVKNCCVKNCTSKSKKGDQKISLHLFPTNDSNLLQQWIDFLGYGSDWTPTKYATICSIHFTAADFRLYTNTQRLKPNAIPSIRNPDDHVPPSAGPVELLDPIENYCRLCGTKFKSELKRIYDDHDSYACKINDYLHITISPEDILPLTMCSVCEKKLNQCVEFIKLVEKSQQLLMDVFTKIHNRKWASSTPLDTGQTDVPDSLSRKPPVLVDKKIEILEEIQISNSESIPIQSDISQSKIIIFDTEKSELRFQPLPTSIDNDFNTSDYTIPNQCEDQNEDKSSDVRSFDKFRILDDIKLQTPFLDVEKHETVSQPPPIFSESKFKIIDEIQIKNSPVKPNCEIKSICVIKPNGNSPGEFASKNLYLRSLANVKTIKLQPESILDFNSRLNKFSDKKDVSLSDCIQTVNCNVAERNKLIPVHSIVNFSPYKNIRENHVIQERQYTESDLNTTFVDYPVFLNEDTQGIPLINYTEATPNVIPTEHFAEDTSNLNVSAMETKHDVNHTNYPERLNCPSLEKDDRRMHSRDKIKSLKRKSAFFKRMKKPKLDITSIISKSSTVCKYCGHKFISKYALNHHIKYVCNKNFNVVL